MGKKSDGRSRHRHHDDSDEDRRESKSLQACILLSVHFELVQSAQIIILVYCA